MLSQPVLSGLIDSALVGVGARGRNRKRFCDAMAEGVVTYFRGKQFKTQDKGDGKGGNGTGIGIMSVDYLSMASITRSVMMRVGNGPNAKKFTDAVASAIVFHFESAALLTTVNPQVGKGTGIVIVGSFVIDIGGLKGSLDAAFSKVGANGRNRSLLTLAWATGIVESTLAKGTGTVNITGNVIPPGTAGIGNGVIS